MNKTEKQDSANAPKEKMKGKKRKRKILLGALIVLIGIRIALPYIIKDQIIKAVNAVDGYSCTIEDVDLALYRGGAVIEGFVINITDNDVTEPYVSIKETDISVEWRSLFDGAIVGEAYLTEPVIHFTDGDTEEDQQVGDVSWVQPILDMIPLEINTFDIKEGKVEFENKQSDPQVLLELTNIDLTATNLKNTTEESDSLPSDLQLTSQIMNGGDLEVKGKVNIIKEMPDVDLDIQINSVDLTEINNFTEAYAGFDFESGIFALACEYAMKDSEILGYVKPVLNDLSIFNFKEKGTVLNKFWEAFLGLAFELTENQRADQTATKVPLSGNLDEIEVGVIATILNVFKNAFIQSFDKQTDGSINFGDLKNQNSSDKVEGFIEKTKNLFNSDD